MTPYKLNTGIVNTIIDTDYQSLFFEYELTSEFALYNMFLSNLEIVKCNKGKNKLVVNYFKSLPVEIYKTAFVLPAWRGTTATVRGFMRAVRKTSEKPAEWSTVIL